MENNKLPNGGFPPLKKCNLKQKTNEENIDKGFFYAAKNTINIQKILQDKSNKPIIKKDDEDDLDIVDSV